MTGHAGTCNLLGEHAGETHFYPCGWRCDTHAPWALAGKPRPQPGPGWPAAHFTTPTPDAVAAAIDNRAIASGKRRSSPTAYRAAQAAVTTPKGTP
ncbi:hypothetical protein [Streptomyces sp. NPDC088733]|uniref:hypothetical protein n=1 Tax=Streptomyces sp. NPDC088733 TaxID=3365880 RepID=UPI00381903DA